MCVEPMFNVYRVTLDSPDANARWSYKVFALVPSDQSLQSKGEIHCVITNAHWVLEYKHRRDLAFKDSRGFQGLEQVLCILKQMVESFDSIARTHQPGHQPPVFLGVGPGTPISDSYRLEKVRTKIGRERERRS